MYTYPDPPYRYGGRNTKYKVEGCFGRKAGLAMTNTSSSVSRKAASHLPETSSGQALGEEDKYKIQIQGPSLCRAEAQDDKPCGFVPPSPREDNTSQKQKAFSKREGFCFCISNPQSVIYYWLAYTCTGTE